MMKTVLSVLFWTLASPFVAAQTVFAETYDATAGFAGKRIENTTYGYRVFADKPSPAPNTFTRTVFETGADGTFWGITATVDYPLAAGSLIDVAPNGDYVTAETVVAPAGQALRIRRWFAGIPGYFNNLAEIHFPDAVQLNLERLAFRDNYPGGVFLAGHYRTAAEPNQPVAFLVRSDNYAYDWWIHTLTDVPPGTFAFLNLTAFSDGGCVAVFRVNDENRFIERVDATGASRWRRHAGWLTTTVGPVTEGPGGVAFYTTATAPFSGPGATYGSLVAVAPDGSVVVEKDLNAALGQNSVFPRYALPLSGGGAVLAGFESPDFPGSATRFFIARLDAAGQAVWKKQYYYFPNGASFDFGKTSPDNGYLFTGSADGKVFLFKIDQNGTGSATVQYCPAAAGQPWQEWIAGVHIGGLQQESGKTHYSNFTALVAELAIGQQHPIELTAGYSYATYDQYVRIWIDYNRDNVFGEGETAVEALLSRPPDGTPAKTLTADLTVPDSALPGLTRMRVAMARGAYPAPCGNLSFGEVEDYTVDLNISGPAPDLTTTAWELIPANQGCYTDPGQPFGFLAGLALNLGPAGAGHFTARAWLSADDQFGNDDDLLWQEVDFNSIGASGSADNPLGLTIDLPVPPATPPGLYRFFAAVDAGQEVNELEENNNLFQAGIQIGAPDYAVQALSGAPASAMPGETLALSYALSHTGAFPLEGLNGSVHVAFFLSPDSIADNGNEVMLGSQSVDFSALSAAGLTHRNVSLNLPGDVTAGAYFLMLKVTPTNYCDGNPLNDVLIGPAIQVSGQPVEGYCLAQSDFPWHEWIAGVSVADLSNPNNGKSAYTDFTGLSANLVANTTAPLLLTAGFSWTTYPEYWKIWIDYDHDGLFEEPDEVVFQYLQPAPADGTATSSLSGNIAVPAAALPGTTRMRVAMKRGAAPAPCESFSFGEVEDYRVNIAPSFQKPGERALAAGEADLFPNPAAGQTTLRIPASTGPVAVKIFDRNGRSIQEMVFAEIAPSGQSLSLNGFENGVYWLQIRSAAGRVWIKKLVVIN